jgi:hypothetical protein
MAVLVDYPLCGFVDFAAQNMPDFTLKDLQFILTFTGGCWLL